MVCLAYAPRHATIHFIRFSRKCDLCVLWTKAPAVEKLSTVYCFLRKDANNLALDVLVLKKVAAAKMMRPLELIVKDILKT